MATREGPVPTPVELLASHRGGGGASVLVLFLIVKGVLLALWNTNFVGIIELCCTHRRSVILFGREIFESMIMSVARTLV